MDEQKKEWSGVWVPKSIWLNDELGWTEKMLLVEIKSLDNKEGCYASNQYFATFFKLSKDRISKMVTELNRMDYINVELKYKPGTKQVDKRIIRVNLLKYEGVGENADRYGRNQLGAIGENTDTPIGENADYNNTLINNTFNIKPIVADKPATVVQKNTMPDEMVNMILNYFNQKMQKSRGFAKSDSTVKLLNALYKAGHKDIGAYQFVIDNKYNQWINDSKMKTFLVPGTIFAKSNFEKYLDEEEVNINNQQKNIWEEIAYEPAGSEQNYGDGRINVQRLL